jgi:hypothetical protein
MMAQHAQLVAYLSLALFGVVGVVMGLLWRARSFRVAPIALAIGVMVWMLGVVLVSRQIEELHKAAAIQQWPSTAGTVLDSRVIGVRAFRPNIVYQYVVGGVTFRDSTDLDQPGFGGRNNKRNAAETIIALYPPGTRVTVHYDPEQPSVSLLRVSPDWSIFGKLGLGGFMFGVGLFLAVSFFVRTRSVSGPAK